MIEGDVAVEVKAPLDDRDAGFGAPVVPGISVPPVQPAELVAAQLKKVTVPVGTPWELSPVTVAVSKAVPPTTMTAAEVCVVVTVPAGETPKHSAGPHTGL